MSGAGYGLLSPDIQRLLLMAHGQLPPNGGGDAGGGMGLMPSGDFVQQQPPSPQWDPMKTTPPINPQKETTRLGPKAEAAFKQWIKRMGVTDADSPESRYDYRGAFKAGVKPQISPVDGLPHWPDTFKQHGHPSFSIESQYSAGPNDGGMWVGENLIPQMSAPDVQFPTSQQATMTSPISGMPQQGGGGLLPGAQQSTLPGPSLWQRVQSRLLPVPESLQGLLGAGDLESARRQGLLAIGASLMANSGPVVGRPAPSLGQLIGQGIGAGQEATMGAVGQSVNAQRLVQQMQDQQLQRQDSQHKRDLEERRQSILAKYSDRMDDPSALEQLAKDLAAGGFANDAKDAATSARAIRENAVKGPEWKLSNDPATDPSDGKLKQVFYRTAADGTLERKFGDVVPVKPVASGGGSGGMRPQLRMAFNPATQRNELAMITQDGPIFTGAIAPTTESQRAAAADMPQIKSAIEGVIDMTDPNKGPQKGVSILDYGLSKVGTFGNALKSDAYQTYEQAFNEFLSIYPFMRGGKQLTETEIRTITTGAKILPFDNAATKARKRAFLQKKIEEVQSRAGPIGDGATSGGDAGDLDAAKKEIEALRAKKRPNG